MFPVENVNNDIHPKTVIFGVQINDRYTAYRESDLIAMGRIEDRVGDVLISIERDPSGVVTVKNMFTGEEIVKERDFWFVWYAFHPETELYKR
jgi:hypothetical protein